MRSHGNQLDVIRHSPPAMVAAHRQAAQASLLNPYETPEACERRAAWHRSEADRIERQMQHPPEGVSA